MSAIEESFNKLIRDTIDLILGIPGYAIKAKQEDAPRPQGAYAAVDWATGLDIGWEQSTKVNNAGDPDITEFIEGMREVRLAVGFYRTDAIDNARAVRIGLIRESIQSFFKASNVGLITRTTVLEISEAFENGWEERATFDIALSAVGSDSDLIRSIAAVDIAGEFQARGLIYNINIEV